ncbi:MAG: hypothetical protein HC879_09845 [Leptolyngbyaceae cyanobacterium SL_5_9]|nr:hypothetical protein [Leptolyngbyaceae cyanobacterium SL_5_9]NJO74829.1 hypothetical protein [Leptolyngbyaceae cyanobacterium RM1_406_9]
MNIAGIWAENSYLLAPEQWVNVWLINYWSEAEFYTCCQVKDLAIALASQSMADPSEFALEPVEAKI